MYFIDLFEKVVGTASFTENDFSVDTSLAPDRFGIKTKLDKPPT